MELVGRDVCKEFSGSRVLTGVVELYDATTGLYRVAYEDGNSEELGVSEVTAIVRSAPEKVAKKRGRKPKKRHRNRDDPGKSCGISVDDSRVHSSGDCAGELGLGRNLIDEVSANGDLRKSVVVNGGLDLNLDAESPAIVDSEKNSFFRASIDLNLSAVNDIDEGLGSDCKEEELEKKELGFDLNQVVDDEPAELDTEHKEYLVDVPTEMVESKGSSSLDTAKGLNVASVCLSRALNDSVSDQRVSEYQCLDSIGVDQDDKESLRGNKSDLMDAANVNSDVSMLVEAATPVSCEDEPNSSRKRRKLVSRLRSPGEGSLRRSARRAKALAAAQNKETDADIACEANDISSPGMSVISEEKPNLMDNEGVEESEVILTWVQLPPSSKNLDLEGMPVLDLFSVYAFMRSFSALLYLSPFKLEDFVASLKSKAANSLLDSIHVAILQTLRNHLELLSNDGSEPASTCLRNLNWDLLDVVTWPIFLAEYLLISGSGLKPCFSIDSLNLVDGDYYKQTADVKIAILQCLCDGIMEVECVRTEVNRRTSTSDFGDIEKPPYTGTLRKTRAFVGSADNDPLAEDNGGDSTDWNSDECCLCKMEGNLICCDGCPAAYHSRCVGVASSLLPDGDWFCPECLNNGRSSEIKLQKHVRGAEVLGADPHGRVYFHCCGYLLVSESSDAESSFNYYHRDDFCTVIHVLESSGFPYGPISKALSKHLTVHSELDHQESCTLAAHKPIEHIVASGDGALKVEEGHERKSEGFGNPTTSSDGSAEVLQAVENTSAGAKKRKRGRPRLLDRKPSSAKAKIVEEPPKQLDPLYLNHYSFGRIASAIAEEIMCKPSDKTNDILLRSEEEIISAQLKVISKKCPRFCWPNIQDTCAEIQKEKCGWCYACRSPDEDRSCLFNLNVPRSISASCKAELDVFRSKQNKMGHLLDITCYIFCMESRLQGLLLGPWLHPDGSHLNIVEKASDFASVKHHLLLLESNLRPSALSADWGKHVDLHVKMGSASHIVVSTRVASKSGVGIWRKKNRLSGLDPTPVNATGGLVMLWWRGGKMSRKLFNWKVLPRSLALHGARNGGFVRIPGLTYPDGSEHVKRTKQIAWRAAVEMCTSVAQLALLVRELDSSIRWDEIENTHILPTLDKESLKSVKLFKKVVVRRKCVEGAVVKYLLDFGKRRLLPEVVQRHGCKEDDPASERKKYWLEESLLPLHLLRNFEEKRIARKAGKMTPKKALKGDKAQKKPSKIGCFDYLFARAERSSYHQCGHCKKDVPISEAVSCQHCDGYFHKRHVRRTSTAAAKKCKYACHKCQSGKHVPVLKKRGRIKLSKIQNRDGKKPANLPVKVKGKRGRKPKANRSQMVLGKKRRVQVSKNPSRQSTEVNADAGSAVRRSARIKGAPVHYDEVSEDSKSEKPSKSSSGRPRRKSSRISKRRSYKKKRSVPLSSFWKNGLKLIRKLDDERVADFKRRRLLIPSEISAATADQPKCKLCAEEGHTASLKYIACEICGAWYHGDAFGLDAEVIKSLIGFRCHSCLKRVPPTCPCVEDVMRHAPISDQTAANTGADTAHCLPEEVSDPMDADLAQNHASDAIYEDPIQAQNAFSKASTMDTEPVIDNENLSADEGPVRTLPTELVMESENLSLKRASAMESEDSEPVMENENLSANEPFPAELVMVNEHLGPNNASGSTAEPVLENEYLSPNKASGSASEPVLENEHSGLSKASGLASEPVLENEDLGPNKASGRASEPVLENEHLGPNKASGSASEPVLENEHLGPNKASGSASEPVLENEHLGPNKASGSASEPVLEGEHLSPNNASGSASEPVLENEHLGPNNASGSASEPVLENEHLGPNKASGSVSEPALENEHLGPNKTSGLASEPVSENEHLGPNKASALASEPVSENGHSSAEPVLEICSKASGSESEPVPETGHLSISNQDPPVCAAEPVSEDGHSSANLDGKNPVLESEPALDSSSASPEGADRSVLDGSCDPVRDADVSNKSDVDAKLACDTDVASDLHSQGEPDKSAGFSS